jgi:NAD(P)-dependent dehydrogenase (short-subunit alcohol dehydrogenase family)
MTAGFGRTELEGSTVLILGGAGLVGISIARLLLEHRPKRIVVGSLWKDDAEKAVEGLCAMPEAEGVQIDPTWGDIFVPHEMKDRNRGEILDDPEARDLLVNDIFGELNSEVLHRSALGALLLEVRPDVVVDSVNTAGAIAYQNSFAKGRRGWRRWTGTWPPSTCPN